MVFQNIRSLREDHDLSQKQVAHLLGIAQTTYSGYEVGAHDYPTEVLLKLADYYQTSVDYLLDRTDDPAPPKRRA
ncbi:MAG: helix-turn-helix transcriptional regulator [Eubacteriales bacterium]|nr:helix-turn-helix transcriptional regulator [Eubacteriales bacterium]